MTAQILAAVIFVGMFALIIMDKFERARGRVRQLHAQLGREQKCSEPRCDLPRRLLVRRFGERKLRRQLVDHLHIPQELRIRSRGTERHSASN